MDAITDERRTDAAPSISDTDLDALIEEADKAKRKAYAPYSNFRVGAALLATSGKIYSGCNIENCSYGLSNCAERTAVFKAVSCGDLKFRAIAITSDVSSQFTYPCGACRQVLSEFGNMDVFLVLPDGRTSRSTLYELIPYVFNKNSLEGTENSSKTD